jgi:hypothetical protein
LAPLASIPEITANKTIYYNKKISYWARIKPYFKKAYWPLKILLPYKGRELIFKRFVNIENSIKNKMAVEKPLSVEVAERNLLKDLYWDDVKILKSITGLSFNEWKEFNE